MRRYFRLVRNDGGTAILMESVPDHDSRATPGHRIGDFIRIGGWLRDIGLRAPEIYAADEDNGYMLLEDFGDLSFKAALGRGMDPALLYGLATDVLIRIRRADAASVLALPSYYDSHVHKGRRRIVDWYAPILLGRRNPDGMAEEYLAVWDMIERSLPSCPQGFLHIDYHVENLMWTGGKGPACCGILDFQGAMIGPVPYDLANLLEDARTDVAPELRRAMLDLYCAGMGAAERELFENWYRVLATQFHCRLMGQFIRLALALGKPRYLAFLPRVADYLREGLADPVLAPLAGWFRANGIVFDPGSLPHVDADAAAFIRDDAF